MTAPGARHSIVRGGRVVTAAGRRSTTAVAIRGGTIVALGPEALLPPAERIIDATGKYVLPGLIDCHVHLGAGVRRLAAPAPLAAAHAGLTTLLLVRRVRRQARDAARRRVERLREEAEAHSVLDFGFHFILNHEPYILEGIAEAVRAWASRRSSSS